MRTPRLATLAAASTVALLALGGTAFALGTDDTPPPAATSTATAAPTTTIGAVTSAVGGARASAIAVERVGGGQVVKVERELEHGRLEWKVDVLRDGVVHEVRVDDATGTVTRTSSSAAPLGAAPGTAAPRSAAPRSAPAPAVRSDDGSRHDVGDDHGGASGRGSDDGGDSGRHSGGHDD